MLSANPSQVFPALKINWSVNNIPVSGNKAIGQITTSHYSPSEGQLYILGAADNDTDENDDHVIAHEWGHYFEDKFSRSDSLGGSHSGNDRLDLRVAFGEGFGETRHQGFGGEYSPSLKLRSLIQFTNYGRNTINGKVKYCSTFFKIIGKLPMNTIFCYFT